ncbi:MAG TPA: BON domain-containing protein [Gemmata sp.]
MFSHLLTSKTLRTLAAVAGVAATGHVFATDPLPPAAPAAKPVSISDVSLANQINAAFDADPILRNVQVLVSVVDRGAVIFGPVNSEEVKKRAEAVARTVPGIASVKNTCFVDADPDPLLRAVASQMKPGTKPAGATPLPGVALPPTAADGFIPKAPPQPPTDLVAMSPNKTVVAQHPNVLGAPVNVLGAPVIPRPTGAPLLPPAGTPAPGALTGSTSAKPADMQTAVAAVRATDPRFAKLTAEVKSDGKVFVSGSVAKAEDAWDFATALRKVPGVTRIALDPNTVK